MTKGYGVTTVVGDVHSSYVPTVINRTVLEYEQLRRILIKYFMATSVNQTLELGCGYGRMLPLLKEFSNNVYAMERDDELRGIAHQLNPRTSIFPMNWTMTPFPWVGRFDLILTYTFMQHLTSNEFDFICHKIHEQLLPDGFFIAVEDFYPPERFIGFKLIHKEPRIKEATNPNNQVGQLMVFKKA